MFKLKKAVIDDLFVCNKSCIYINHSIYKYRSKSVINLIGMAVTNENKQTVKNKINF